jgi:hypothetical protein
MNHFRYVGVVLVLALLSGCRPAEEAAGPEWVAATIQLRGAVTEDYAGDASAFGFDGVAPVYVNLGGRTGTHYTNLYLVLDAVPEAGASWGWDATGSTASFGHALRQVDATTTHEAWNAAYCGCAAVGSGILALTSVEQTVADGGTYFLLHGTADAILPATPDGTGTVTFHAEF